MRVPLLLSSLRYRLSSSDLLARLGVLWSKLNPDSLPLLSSSSSASFSLPDTLHSPDLPERSELLELYRIAIEEYRFEVQLGWSRAQHFLVLSGGTLAAGAGLLKIGPAEALPSWTASLPVALVFLFGAAASVLGILAVRRGHRYYKTTVFKKTLLEEELGYTRPIGGDDPVRNLAITTTRGMGEIREILDG